MTSMTSRHLTLLTFTAVLSTLLGACDALDPIPLVELQRDVGTSLPDLAVADTGVDQGDDAGVDLGLPVETQAERWLAEACAFARRCESKERLARYFQPLCAAPAGVTPDVLLPPEIYIHVLESTFEDRLTPAFEAYLAAAVDACDPKPFLEPDRVFRGARGEGEPCGSDFECDTLRCSTGALTCDDLRCLPPRQTSHACTRDGGCPLGDYCHEGVCARIPVTGAPCPTGRCGSGDYCSTQHVCRPRGDAGDPCARAASGGDTCAPGLVCTDPGGGAPASCTPGAPLGASCDITTTPCASGLRCDNTNVCVLPGLEGDSCASEEDCVGGFACADDLCTRQPLLGAPCSLDVPCLVGQCIDGACSRPTAGFACGTSSLLFPGIGCLDSYCESGMCHEYQVLGGACVEQSTCGPSRVCSGGVCVDRRGLGEPCVREGDGPPCANTFECVGANGAQTCQLCD